MPSAPPPNSGRSEERRVGKEGTSRCDSSADVCSSDLACHAHDKVPSHNVTTEIKDSAVVANDAQRAAAEFGFTRMWSIHPDQIKPIVKAFTPRLAEVNEATSILTAAMAKDWGPIAHGG